MNRADKGDGIRKHLEQYMMTSQVAAIDGLNVYERTMGTEEAQCYEAEKKEDMSLCRVVEIRP